MHKATLGIVIVSYNVKNFLDKCLASIFSSDLGEFSVKVVVVDNHSQDGTLFLVEEKYPQVITIQNIENKGFSIANNQGIKLLNTPYVLLLNPDTILEPHVLSNCLNAFDEYDNVGAIGVRMVDGQQNFLPESKRQIPNLWNSFCKLTFLSSLFPTSSLFSGYNLGHLSPYERHDITVLCGAFMMMKSSVLDKIGLLDEDFFMYGEDIDLSHRIVAAGYSIKYLGDLQIIHFKGESTKKWSIDYVRTFYGAMAIYAGKHYTGRYGSFFKAIIDIGIRARSLVSVIIRVWIHAFRPILDGLLIYTLLSLFVLAWALYNFNDIHYYDKASIYVNVVFYSFLWLVSLWFYGHYDRYKGAHNTWYGIFVGTLIILVWYALAPQDWRSSRMLILAGTCITIGTVLSTEYLMSKFLIEKVESLKDKYIGVITLYERVDSFNAKAMRFGWNLDYIYYFSLSNNPPLMQFVGPYTELHNKINSLRINAVIIDIPHTELSHLYDILSVFPKYVHVYISAAQSTAALMDIDISDDKGFYKINYALDNALALRQKRLFDLVISTCLIAFFPIFWIINQCRWSYWSNVWAVLLCKMTWVGYGGEKRDYVFLPPIKPSVIKVPTAGNLIIHNKKATRIKNIEYARRYTVLHYLKIVIQNLFSLADDDDNLRSKFK